ncbi:hypothetical protein ACFQYP_26230 [Nonomuraea antimicrobica]
MAPEQWDEAPAGPATDVYAATLVFYECLTGHRAFHGENVAALAYQHQHVPPPLEDIEEPLRPLLEHGLAKDPEGRPESAEAFLDELERTARAAYGEDWELRGRTGLGGLALPLVVLLPKPQPVADGGATSLFHSALSPVGKFAVTGGLVLATTAAVVSTFVILGDSPDLESGTALPPATSAPPFTPAPAAPTTAPPTTVGPTGIVPTLSEPITPPVADPSPRPPPAARDRRPGRPRPASPAASPLVSPLGSRPVSPPASRRVNRPGSRPVSRPGPTIRSRPPRRPPPRPRTTLPAPTRRATANRRPPRRARPRSPRPERAARWCRSR